MSKYNVDVEISEYRNDILCDSTYSKLMNDLEDIFNAFYSTVISLRMYFFNQYDYLTFKLEEKEKEVLEFIFVLQTGKTTAESKKSNEEIKELLGQWLSIRYLMDNAVMYFHKGESLDKELISLLFEPQLTSIDKRPSINELKEEHENFAKLPWNLCSYYGIKANLKLLSRGTKYLKELVTSGKLKHNHKLENRAKQMVYYLISSY